MIDLGIPMHKKTLLAAGCLWLAAGPALAEAWSYPGWQDGRDTRVKALALLQTLNATLLSNSSATRTLQQWCADHRMASPAQIRALRNPADHKDASPEVRAQLQARPGERIAYYHIAGHYDEAPDLKVDTHGAPVIDPVWDLLGKAYARFGVRPTLLERDTRIPPLPELLAELATMGG